MAKANNKDYVSFWFWMWALFVTALPCIRVIRVIVWAFVGVNESRKNYFRALIAWFVILSVLWLVVLSLGFWPEIQRHLQAWWQRR